MLPANAQIISGDLIVRVIDQSNLAVPGATLSLVDVNTNIAHSALTDSLGTYLFAQLKPGAYRLDVASTGFTTKAASSRS